MENQNEDIGSERERVRLCQKGDARAFDELMRLHQRALFGYLMALLKNPDAADEVTQSAFIKAWKKIRSFRGDAGFKTWLFRIAINEARDYQRRTWWKRKISLEAPLAGTDGVALKDTIPAPHQAEPLHQAESQAAGKAVRNEIDSLPPRQKEVLGLRAQGWALKDIAGALDITEGSVKTQLFEAKKKITTALRKEDMLWTTK